MTKTIKGWIRLTEDDKHLERFQRYNDYTIKGYLEFYPTKKAADEYRCLHGGPYVVPATLTYEVPECSE